jgi:hypothetical protein
MRRPLAAGAVQQGCGGADPARLEPAQPHAREIMRDDAHLVGRREARKRPLLQLAGLANGPAAATARRVGTAIVAEGWTSQAGVSGGVDSQGTLSKASVSGDGGREGLEGIVVTITS